MIWTTAKSTDVNRRSTVRPMRSNTSGFGGRADSAHAVTGLAIAGSSGSDGGRLGRRRRPPGGFGGWRVAVAGRGRRLERGAQRGIEVGDEVVEVLEPDRAAEQSRGDPGRDESVVIELAVGRRRRMADDREHAPE